MRPQWIIGSLLSAYFALLFSGCERSDASVKSIPALVKEIEASIQAGNTTIKIQVRFSGDLIFASPHSVDSNAARLTGTLGAKITENLKRKTGLSESFYIFVVSSNGDIESLRWEAPELVFNELFLVNCQPGDHLLFDIEDKVLRGIQIERK